jgi:TRAP-type C4-dicarboxylate transport system, small permease component
MRKLFDQFEEYAILLLFPMMVAVVLAATLGRYTQWYSMFWGEEAARYIMVYLGYIGISLAMKRRAHIGVTAVTDMVKGIQGKKVVLILQTGIILLFCAIISYFVLSLIEKQAAIGQTSPSMLIPMWIPYAAVPLGMILLAIRTCQVLVERLKELDAESKE